MQLTIQEISGRRTTIQIKTPFLIGPMLSEFINLRHLPLMDVNRNKIIYYLANINGAILPENATNQEAGLKDGQTLFLRTDTEQNDKNQYSYPLRSTSSDVTEESDQSTDEDKIELNLNEKAMISFKEQTVNIDKKTYEFLTENLKKDIRFDAIITDEQVFKDPVKLSHAITHYQNNDEVIKVKLRIIAKDKTFIIPIHNSWNSQDLLNGLCKNEFIRAEGINNELAFLKGKIDSVLYARESIWPVDFNKFEIELHTPTVFLSYCHENEEMVEEYGLRLKEYGIYPWKDTKDLKPGLEWRAQIQKAISSVDYFILFLSSTMAENQDSPVYEEILQAEIQRTVKAYNGVFILPVKIDSTDFSKYPKLANIHKLYSIDGTNPDAFTCLYKTIQNDYKCKMQDPVIQEIRVVND